MVQIGSATLISLVELASAEPECPLREAVIVDLAGESAADAGSLKHFAANKLKDKPGALPLTGSRDDTRF